MLSVPLALVPAVVARRVVGGAVDERHAPSCAPEARQARISGFASVGGPAMVAA